MNQVDRVLIGTLMLGVWCLVALQLGSVSRTFAQVPIEVEPAQEEGEDKEGTEG